MRCRGGTGTAWLRACAIWKAHWSVALFCGNPIVVNTSDTRRMQFLMTILHTLESLIAHHLQTRIPRLQDKALGLNQEAAGQTSTATASKSSTSTDANAKPVAKDTNVDAYAATMGDDFFSTDWTSSSSSSSNSNNNNNNNNNHNNNNQSIRTHRR